MVKPTFLRYSRGHGYSGARVGKSKLIPGQQAVIATKHLHQLTLIPYIGKRKPYLAGGKWCFTAGGRLPIVDGNPTQKLTSVGDTRLEPSDFIGSYVNEAPVGGVYNLVAICLRSGDLLGIKVPSYPLAPHEDDCSVWYVLVTPLDSGEEMFIPYGDAYEPIRRKEKYTPAPADSYGTFTGDANSVKKQLLAWFNEERIVSFWTSSLAATRSLSFGAPPPTLEVGCRVAYCYTFTAPNSSLKEARYYIWRIVLVMKHVRRSREGFWWCQFEDDDGNSGGNGARRRGARHDKGETLCLSPDNFHEDPRSIKQLAGHIAAAAGKWSLATSG